MEVNDVLVDVFFKYFILSNKKKKLNKFSIKIIYRNFCHKFAHSLILLINIHHAFFKIHSYFLSKK